MGKFYTLKDFVHEQGLNMGEFRKLDKDTQEKWREIHQRKLKEKLIERDENVFRNYFLAILKHVDPDKFDTLAQWKQEEWRRQYEMWKKQEERNVARAKKSKDELNYQSAMDILADCGVPFAPDGTLLGI